MASCLVYKSLCDHGDPDPVQIRPDHNHHVFLLFIFFLNISPV